MAGLTLVEPSAILCNVLEGQTLWSGDSSPRPILARTSLPLSHLMAANLFGGTQVRLQRPCSPRTRPCQPGCWAEACILSGTRSKGAMAVR